MTLSAPHSLISSNYRLILYFVAASLLLSMSSSIALSTISTLYKYLFVGLGLYFLRIHILANDKKPVSASYLSPFDFTDLYIAAVARLVLQLHHASLCIFLMMGPTCMNAADLPVQGLSLNSNSICSSDNTRFYNVPGHRDYSTKAPYLSSYTSLLGLGGLLFIL